MVCLPEQDVTGMQRNLATCNDYLQLPELQEEKYLPAEEHLLQAATLGQWPSVAVTRGI
jgi:hypothetical protein